MYILEESYRLVHTNLQELHLHLYYKFVHVSHFAAKRLVLSEMVYIRTYRDEKNKTGNDNIIVFTHMHIRKYFH